MSAKRLVAGIAAAAAISGSLLAGATVTAGTAGADPWKCESGNCGPWFPGPGDWGKVPGWGEVPGWGNLIPWGHLPEGWH